MSAARRIGAPLCAALACYLAAVYAQGRTDAARAAAAGGEDALLYLPNERLLTHFTAGLGSVAADLLWVQCVAYTADQVRGERSFQWLEHMVNTVVRLDPYFVDAYRYGGMFLAALRADDDAGLRLLQRGMVQHPFAWQLPYEAAMIYLLNRNAEPDSLRAAGVYLGMAAALPGAPQLARDLAERLQGDYDLIELEEDMWRALIDSPDTLLRDVAAGKLADAQVRRFLRDVNAAIARSRFPAGAAPQTLQDLVDAGILDALPTAPPGREFRIGPDGRVYLTQ